VLTEVSAHERALAELKRIFEGVTANEHGCASRVELTASLEHERNLLALLKEAGLNEILHVVSRLVSHEGDFVSWDEFQQYAQKAVVQEVEREVKETEKEVAAVVRDAKEMDRQVEEMEKEVAADLAPNTILQEVEREVKEAAKEVSASVREVKDLGSEAAAKIEAGEKVFQLLKELFESLASYNDRGVSKDELLTRLSKDMDDANGNSFGKLIEKAGFNPVWNDFEQLDTNEDGRITWDEFKAHIEKVDIVLEEAVSVQCRWGCC